TRPCRPVPTRAGPGTPRAPRPAPLALCAAGQVVWKDTRDEAGPPRLPEHPAPGEARPKRVGTTTNARNGSSTARPTDWCQAPRRRPLTTGRPIALYIVAGVRTAMET